jgi:hypothetical protein
VLAPGTGIVMCVRVCSAWCPSGETRSTAEERIDSAESIFCRPNASIAHLGVTEPESDAFLSLTNHVLFAACASSGNLPAQPAHPLDAQL